MYFELVFLKIAQFYFMNSMADLFSLFGYKFRFQVPSEVFLEETMTIRTKLVRKDRAEVHQWTGHRGEKFQWCSRLGQGRACPQHCPPPPGPGNNTQTLTLLPVLVRGSVSCKFIFCLPTTQTLSDSFKSHLNEWAACWLSIASAFQMLKRNTFVSV